MLSIESAVVVIFGKTVSLVSVVNTFVIYAFQPVITVCTLFDILLDVSFDYGVVNVAVILNFGNYGISFGNKVRSRALGSVVCGVEVYERASFNDNFCGSVFIIAVNYSFSNFFVFFVHVRVKIRDFSRKAKKRLLADGSTRFCGKDSPCADTKKPSLSGKANADGSDRRLT